MCVGGGVQSLFAGEDLRGAGRSGKRVVEGKYRQHTRSKTEIGI